MEEWTLLLARNHFMQKASWVILVCISIIVMQIYVLMQCISPLMYTVINDLNISHSAGGFLYAVPVMMIGVFSFPLGIFSDRVGFNRAIIYAAIIVIFSSLSRALTSNYVTLLIFTAMFGGGMALFFPNLSKIVNEYFPKHLVGRATGVYTAAIPFGSGLGIALTKNILLLTGSWRYTVGVWSVITIPFILTCLFYIQKSRKRFIESDILHAESRSSSRRSTGNVMAPGSSKKYWCSPIILCGILLAFLNYVFFSTIGWLPTYLIEKGWGHISAGAVTSVISFVEVPCILLVPYISHRTGRTKSIFVISFLIIALSLCAISIRPTLSWVFAPILGLTFGGTFVLLLAFPAQFSIQRTVGRSAGAIFSMGYIGGLLGPFSSGYLRDVTGNFSFMFMVMVGVSLIACALSLTFPSMKTMTSK